MTKAKIGYGSAFSLHNGLDPGALVEISEVTAITLPQDVVDAIEATHFKSPGAKREYIAGLIETGEGEVEMNWVGGDATDVLLRAAVAARSTRAYKFSVPATTGLWEISGNCIPLSYVRGVPLGDRMTATLSVKFTGDTTEAAAA
jgi:hypothetical protein